MHKSSERTSGATTQHSAALAHASAEIHNPLNAGLCWCLQLGPCVCVATLLVGTKILFNLKQNPFLYQFLYVFTFFPPPN